MANPSPARMLARGLAKHCAVCGGGDLFCSWFKMRDRCPTCGYRFEREEGFFLGSYTVNLAITEGLLLLLGVLPCIAILAGDPDASLVPVIAGGLIAAVVSPVLLYPFSRTIWVAIDLALRPTGASEPGDQQ